MVSIIQTNGFFWLIVEVLVLVVEVVVEVVAGDVETRIIIVAHKMPITLKKH